MKPISVSYSRGFYIGSFLQEKIGIELSVGENEFAEDVLKEAIKFVEEEHKKNNPHLYQDSDSIVKTFGSSQKENSNPKETMVANIIQQINECTDIKVLESFKLIAQKYSEVKPTYDTRLFQLTKKPNP